MARPENIHRQTQPMINSEPPKNSLFTDLDFLLLFFSIFSYIGIRFLVDCGLIFGSFFSYLVFVFLRRSTSIRHTCYLYVILLFTSQKDQMWLLRKFSLNSKIYSSSNHEESVNEIQLDDTINKALSIIWPFAKRYLEEVILQKISSINDKIFDSRTISAFRSLIHVQAKDVAVGDQFPLLREIKVYPSKKNDSLVLECGFMYDGKANFNISTNVKNVLVQNFRVAGHLRIEAGPFLCFPPFVENVRCFMTDEPQLSFDIRGVPEKIENLLKIISLEKISKKLVMPNQITLLSHPRDYESLFPQGVILVHVVEAQNLPNKETFCQSDPFCVVRLGSHRASTKTVLNNLNPFWKFKTQLICPCDPRSGDFDLSVSVFDEDVFFDDFLFRAKLSVRRIMEEVFVDEWLYNKDNDEKGNTQKGKLRIQTIWQNFSQNASETTQASVSSTISPQNFSEGENFGENSPGSVSRLSSSSSNQNRTATLQQELAQQVLFVWVESAEKMEPLWEDFRVELTLHDQSLQSSFVPRGIDGTWPFRKSFLALAEGVPEDRVILKVVSGSKESCCGQLTLPVSLFSYQTATSNPPQMREFRLKDRNGRNLDSTLKVVLAKKDIEKLSTHHSRAIYRAELEASRALVRHPQKLSAPLTQTSDESYRREKSTKAPSMFSFTEISWDACPSFALSNTLRD